MPNLSCRYYENELPVEGEIVVGKISDVNEIGVFMQVVEYNNLEGLIVMGELTRKRISNAQKAVKSGKVEVALVSRVDSHKKYVDLSRVKVTSEERSKCLQKHYKNKNAHNTMITIAQKADVDLIDLYKQFGWKKAEEYGTLYEYFYAVQNDPSIIKDEEHRDLILEAVNLRFKVDKIKVCAEVNVCCYNIRGVLAIKDALAEAMKNDNEIDIRLIKSPIFNVITLVNDSSLGIKKIEEACKIIKDRIEKEGGLFSMNEKPKIFGIDKNEENQEAVDLDEEDE